MFHYVIVGGGSAGCALAARLSEDPNTQVCMLEAGPPDDSFFIRMPMGVIPLMRSRKLNWKFETEPEPNLKGRRLFWPRGRTLGGSSSVNAMCYIRGHRSDYDHWAELGNPGWSYEEVLPYFKKFENRERGANDYHGSGGPYNAADPLDPNELSLAFIRAAEETGLARNTDFNGAEQEGAGLYEVTQKGGERCSNARAFLRTPGPDGKIPGQRPNLTIITDARATRILFEGKRAVGAVYRRQGKRAEARAEREVLLCGGAVNSPQLLLLSGVGTRGELDKHGIECVHELPGVGKNLQDHLDVLVVDKAISHVGYSLGPATLGRTLDAVYQYVSKRRGQFTSNAAEAGGFAKTDPGLDKPDVQYHFLPVIQEKHGLALRRSMGFGFSLHICALRPNSRGHIGLKSADPMADPLIQPNYLDDKADLRTMIAGVRAGREIFAAPALNPHRGEEIFPGDDVQSDAEIEDFIRERGETIYHPVGTCKMGTDDMAVVDPQLRVHGLEGLRVADASIMPTLTGGNTNAPTTMIAEKAADMILQARPAKSEESYASSEQQSVSA